jgi:tetratricopeptide (TPR) repeat protein
VPDPIEPNAASRKDGSAPQESAPAAAANPLILVPMTADDDARKRRRTKLIWVLAVLAMVGATAYLYRRSQTPRLSQEAFEAGQRLFAVARYPQAILSFDRAVALNPGFEEAYLMRGRSHSAQYENDQALADFTRAIELSPRDTRPLLQRSSAYFLDKKFDLAVADASAAIAADPKLASAYNLRGMALREQGKLTEALADLNQAVALAPNPDNYFQRGATFQLLGEYRPAIADFTSTIEFQPDVAHGYFARAECERALGDAEAAKKDHQKGRILDGR